jgi:hypothetical protein
MHFVTFEQVAERFKGKSVAIVGSAPSVLDNAPGLVDSFDVVVRVNNYKTGAAQGYRCDVHYAFYGASVTKSDDSLKADGVTLCMCKCPNDKPIASEWHQRHNRNNGVDFRYIYQSRATWWFCDTFVPDVPRFMYKFDLLAQHIPTTGFAAVIDVIDCNPSTVYLTGFDFFASRIHNVDERWRPGNPNDPIGHRPEIEAAWIAMNAHRYPMLFDKKLSGIIEYHLQAMGVAP